MGISKRSLSPFAVLALGVCLVALGACEPEPDGQDEDSVQGVLADPTQPFFQGEEEVSLSRSETLYASVYSNILVRDGEVPFEMASTLAIRNTDLDTPIYVTSVTYYDSKGTLLETFLDGTFGLAPLATASFFIKGSDTRGGLGAKFIVKWGAEVPVSDPIVETLTVGSSGSQAFSFISPARVIDEPD